MNISSIRNKNNNKGFTLIELIIVIGGLAALGSFTFPNILTQLKLGLISAIISSLLFVSVVYYLNSNYFEIDLLLIKNSFLISISISFILSFLISIV